MVRGLGGNDALDGRKGHDVLIGGNPGDDTITDWLGIAGQPDDGAVDTFKGGAGNDILYVGAGDPRSPGRATTGSTATTSARATSCTAARARTCSSSTRTSTASRPTSARRSWSSTRGENRGMSFPFYDDPAGQYPPDTYHRDTGEASAWIRPSATTPEIEYANGGKLEYLLTGPRSAGTARHLPLEVRREGERTRRPLPQVDRQLFYVLEGEVRLYDGRGWHEAGAGDFLYVPEGGLHGFRGGNHARMLLMFTPGHPGGYFETLAGLGLGGTMPPEERVEFMCDTTPTGSTEPGVTGRATARADDNLPCPTAPPPTWSRSTTRCGRRPPTWARCVSSSAAPISANARSWRRPLRPRRRPGRRHLAGPSAVARDRDGRHFDAQVNVTSARMVEFSPTRLRSRRTPATSVPRPRPLAPPTCRPGRSWRSANPAPADPSSRSAPNRPNGCAKFVTRYGDDAMRFVNSETGKQLRLRGFNARVVEAGVVRPGDVVRVVRRGGLDDQTDASARDASGGLTSR